MKKVNIIVEARMSSSRLPGKTMKMVNGQPMLYWLVSRMRKCNKVNNVIVATTINPQDDIIENFCNMHKINVFRGEESDVLRRVYSTALSYQTDVIVEVTGDNPCADPLIIDSCIEQYLCQDVDLIATDLGWYNSSFRKNVPIGLGCKVFGFETLKKMNEEAIHLDDREHVINYAMQNLDKFKVRCFESVNDFENIRLTVDYTEDFNLIKNIFGIFKGFESDFTYTNIHELYRSCPMIFKVNINCTQKKYER